MLADLVLALGTYVLALAIRFDWSIPSATYVGNTLLLIALVRPVTAAYFGVYQGMLRYFGLWDYLTLAKAVTAGSVVVAASTYFLGMQYHPRSVFLIDWALLLLFAGAFRAALRAWLRHRPRMLHGDKERALIVGTGLAGEQMCRALLEEPLSAYRPVGFIDEAPERWGSRIHGVRVLGGCAELALALSAEKVDVVFLCLADVDDATAEEVAQICRRSGVEVRVVPALHTLLRGPAEVRGNGRAAGIEEGASEVALA
jgi:FlaA1/EpsC-like NDP-sugar epimerase